MVHVCQCVCEHTPAHVEARSWCQALSSSHADVDVRWFLLSLSYFLSLITVLFTMCVYGGSTHVTVHIWRSENDSEDSVLTFHLVCPGIEPKGSSR